MPVALICGATGQDGSYLAELLLEKGYVVFGSSRDADARALNPLSPTRVRAGVRMLSVDLADFRAVLELIEQIKPDEIYNLSGLSSVSLSFAQPLEAMRSIAISTLNLLEVLRFSNSPARFYNAASTECFGDTRAQAPADEATALRPRSPYGVAKSAALMQVANYREAYGLFACSGILANHESLRRPGRFVVRKIVSAAVAISRGSDQRLGLGNTDIVRDWGWAPEYVDAMWRILQQDRPRDYVIATGESHSLGAVVEMIFSAAGLDWRDHVDKDAALLRPIDIRSTYVNPRRAQEELGWVAQTRMAALVDKLVTEERNLPRDAAVE